MLRTTTARETDMSKPGLPIKRVEREKRTAHRRSFLCARRLVASQSGSDDSHGME